MFRRPLDCDLQQGNFPIICDYQKPLDICSREDKIPVRKIILDYLRMFSLSCSNLAFFQPAIANDLTNDLVVGLLSINHTFSSER